MKALLRVACPASKAAPNIGPLSAPLPSDAFQTFGSGEARYLDISSWLLLALACRNTEKIVSKNFCCSGDGSEVGVMLFAQSRAVKP